MPDRLRFAAVLFDFRLSRVGGLCCAAAWIILLAGSAGAAEPAGHNPTRFELAPLASGLKQPMELAVAPDGRVFFIELSGALRVYEPQSQQVKLAGTLTVTTAQENGLIGLALDPNFAENQWIYLQYSPPDFSGQHISRFTLKDGQLDLSSEKLLLKYEEQRRECCHHAGSMEFGPRGELFIGTGDNTHPGGDSKGYAPIDERPDRAPFDAQKSSSNTNSYNGKILRIKPLPDGTYEIPEGNLFPRDGSGGRPEIYVMGCRNPWRVNVDARTGFVYWGEVGPDAGGDSAPGPRGYDEINQARQAGNFGWPYFIANNQAYADVDFATGAVGAKYDLAQPVNASPNNTGARTLPAPQPALIYYPYGASAEFPELGEGGRTACAGPVYYFDAELDSPTKFPADFDRTLFIYEWTRHWIKAVHLDEQSNLTRIEGFLPQQRFARPIDMQFGPEGALYLLEYGETWGVNADARLVRIDYVRGNRAPHAAAAVENNAGSAPLVVQLKSAGTVDKDGDALRYEWRALRAGETAPVVLSREANPQVTFSETGVFNVELIVTDAHGAKNAASVPVLVGNARPRVAFHQPRDGDFFDPQQPLRFRVHVRDAEDGTSDADEADREALEILDPEAPARVTVNAAFVAGPPQPHGAAAADENQGPPGLRLMKRSDCFNCHAVDQQRVGPPLLEVAKKYRDQSGALDASVERVLKGSSGVWGKIPMIPHSQHTRDEVRAMVSWIYELQPDQAARVFQGLVGDIPVALTEAEQGGHFVLEATYIDRGAEELPPLAGDARIRVRSRRLEAEQADEVHGPQVLNSGSAHQGKFAGAINHQHYIRFNQLPLDRVSQVTLRVASAGAGGKIEIRRDRPDGELLATAEIEVNGAWEAWYDRTVALPAQAGRHDLYFVFVNPERTSGLMNLDSVYFHPPAP